MFKKIIIHLTEPICKCEEQNLSWSVPNSNLEVKCKTCDITLTIPSKQFIAGFEFEKSYPGKQKLVKKDGSKEHNDSTNVIPFKKKDDLN